MNYRRKAKLVVNIRLKLLKPTSPLISITLETAQTTHYHYWFYLFHTLILCFIFEYSYYWFVCEVWIQDYQFLAFACYRIVHTFINKEILEFQWVNNLNKTLPIREPIKKNNEPLPVGEPIIKYNKLETNEEIDRERQVAIYV